jgi:hypothetical protein
MKLHPPIRAGLVAAGLATLLSPLLLVGEAALLYGCGIVTPRRHFLGEDNANTFMVFGTLILFIPELVWGLVFGGVFATIGRGRHLAGAISGLLLWSVIPSLYAFPDVAGYAQITSPVNPPEPGWKREYFENLIVLPLAWVAKEMFTGLIIGYVIGGMVARRKNVTNSRASAGSAHAIQEKSS